MSMPEERPPAPSALWSWAIVVAIALAIAVWGLLYHAFVRDAPRQWDFGALEDTPARSAYSTTQPSLRRVPPQQLPLPPKAAKGPPSAPPAPAENKGGIQ